MAALPSRTDIAGTPDNATAKAGFGAVWDYLSGLFGTDGTAATARSTLGVPAENWLHNPDGGVYQRNVAATADDAYMDDRWYALTQTASITPSLLSNPEDGYRYGLRITQSQATAQRMGSAQIVEGRDASQLRGQTVTFGGRFRLSTSANLRMAILAWTGAEDAVTSDVVNNWSSSTYTTGNFFASTTLTLVATSATAMTAATAGDASVSGTVPSGATNLIVLYWTEATAAQNVTLDAWGRRLIAAPSLINCIRRSYAEEEVICGRYALAFLSGMDFEWNGITAASNVLPISLPVSMRATPTVTQPTFDITTNTTARSIVAVNSTMVRLTATITANGYSRVRASTNCLLSADL